MRKGVYLDNKVLPTVVLMAATLARYTNGFSPCCLLKLRIVCFV